ncbi:MAG: chorismate mutase [Clostridia bacterium]|nr:chorismate mutase [Clostridia bacterium]
MSSLKEAREIINRVDREMASLFTERMHAAEMVAEYKREHGLSILDPEREREVIARNSALIENDDIRAYYVRFLEDTMAVSRAYQSKILEGMKVAYSGTEGAFAHIASSRMFPSAKKIAYGSFDSAYAAVVSGECDVAVLPIENSYNGEVGQVTDLIFSGPLFVNGVTELAVTQDLLGVPGVTLSEIEEVVSHPQALGQCHDYILSHGFREKEYSNTALAAKLVAEKGDRTVAAIASEAAAEIYGLEVIERNINASANNTTRFVILSRSENKASERPGRMTSLILFTVRNEAGALARAIDIIGKHGFNMRSLRSRPMKDLLWQYYFYVEAEGSLNTEEGRLMLSELEEHCDRLRVAGSFIKN